MNTHPRKLCREIMQSLVPSDTWAKNEAFTLELKSMINSHRMSSHPLIDVLNAGRVSEAGMKRTHLEFRHAFAQNFTDALIQTMFTAHQLESRQGALGKITARCLLQLNVLDELGFEPNVEAGSDYAADPRKSHYVAFDAVLRELQLSQQQINDYVPSDAAVAARRVVEHCYGDHTLLAATLGVAESIFTRFAGPWAENMRHNTRVDTTQGYHAIHVEHDGHFVDDDHAEDVWFVFRQAVEPSRYDEVRAKVREALDVWAKFCDELIVN